MNRLQKLLGLNKIKQVGDAPQPAPTVETPTAAISRLIPLPITQEAPKLYPVVAPKIDAIELVDHMVRGTDIGMVAGRYQLLKTVGQGKFGKVKLALDIMTGAQVAIKLVTVGGRRHANREQWVKVMKPLMAKEKVVMEALGSHPNIVEFKECITEDFSQSTDPRVDFDRRICFVMEAVDGEELFDVLIREGRFSEERSRHLFRQLLDGLRHCHSKGIYHRDLKPENILIDKNGNLKIIDFGLAAFTENIAVKGLELQNTACGSSSYAAPEVLKGESRGYDPVKADIWSAGVCLFTMVTGTMLLYNADKTTGKELSFNQYLKIVDKVNYGDIVRNRIRDSGKSKTMNLSQPVLSLLLSLLKVDVEQRSSIEKALSNAWITGERRKSIYGDTPVPTCPVATAEQPQESKRLEFRKALVQLDGAKKADLPAIVRSPRGCSPRVQPDKFPVNSPVYGI